MSDNPILSAALEYHARGWSVIPIAANDKKPALRTWDKHKIERAETKTLHGWFCKPKNRIGLVLGPVSGGLIVRDFDKPEAYLEWWQNYPAWRKLPTVQTSRGFHVYARADFAGVAQNAGAKSYLKFDDGELRLWKCYVVAPPSMHESGKPYRWLSPLPPIGEPLPLVDPWDIGWVPSRGNAAVYIEGRETKETQATNATQATQETKETNDIGVVGYSRSNFQTTIADLFHSADVAQRIELAIRGTVPDGPRQRHKLVFELARTLKAIPEVANMEGIALQPILKAWHELASPHSQTSFAETWTDFLDAWDKVRFAKGEEPMTIATENARRGPYPASIADWADEPALHLVGLCRELQRFHLSEPFFLSCHTAGKQVGLSHTQANKHLRSFVKYKVLEVVKLGTPGPNGKATTWRYHGPMDPIEPAPIEHQGS